MNTKTYFLELDDARIFCRVKGQGTPVLLIHGAVCDSDFFEDTADILSKNHMVITYDRRGYSRSTGEINGDFLIIEAADAADILHTLVPDSPAIVIGCSAGALIAMELANLCPDLVSLLILHEPPLTAFLPEDSEVFAISSKVKEYIAQEKYIRAGHQFLLLLENSAPYAKPKSEETLQREEKNLVFFIKNEFAHIFAKRMPPEIPPMIPSAICIGDAHPHHFMHRIAHNFSEQCNVPLLYFPGMHNFAYELPLEFAVQIEGIIKIWKC
ncbi:MAG: alpha/beta hydrolase [Schaedlerella sp.]|nr:alpha/beta hydrolase [Schaedlerella sp.]